MRHEPERTTIAAVIEGIDPRADQMWWQIIGIEIPGLAEAEAAEDFDRASAIEANWLREHDQDPVVVTWPEHVRVPAYDSDATFHYPVQ